MFRHIATYHWADRQQLGCLQNQMGTSMCMTHRQLSGIRLPHPRCWDGTGVHSQQAGKFLHTANLQTLCTVLMGFQQIQLDTECYTHCHTRYHNPGLQYLEQTDEPLAHSAPLCMIQNSSIDHLRGTQPPAPQSTPLDKQNGTLMSIPSSSSLSHQQIRQDGLEQGMILGGTHHHIPIHHL